MRSHNFSKLCPQQDPERGSLAKYSQTNKPVSSTPILTLPPEVRASIFAYLLDDVDLIFKFSKCFNSSTCQTRWQDDKKLAFLKTCKLFEVEALNLVQIHYITIEVHLPLESGTPIPSTPIEKSKNVLRWRPKIALPLDRVRPHIQQLNIDARNALYHLLQTDILGTFAKLHTVRIKQTLWPRVMPSSCRAELDKKSRRQAFIRDSLDERIQSSLDCFVSGGASLCRTEQPALIDLLRHPKLQSYLPLFVDVTIEEYSTSQHSRHNNTDETHSFPISKQISAIRMTYKWPSQEIINLEVDMYDQFMPLAIKSKYTERTELDTRKEDNEDNNGDNGDNGSTTNATVAEH